MRLPPSPSSPAQPAPPPRSASWSAVLASRNFTLLWIGQTVSQFGNQAFMIATMFWLMKASGSASLMGLMMMLTTLPGVVLGPFGGTFADRHSRIRTAAVCDLLAGLGVMAPALLLWLRPEATQTIVALLFAVSLLLGTIRAFFTPAVTAAIPDLVPRKRLAAANSLNQLSVQASVFGGQAAGGVLYALVGAPLLFLLDGLSYLFAALCAWLIPLDAAPVPEDGGTARAFRDFLRETVEGFRYVWGRRGLRDFLFLVSLLNFLAMPVVVLLPFYVDLYLEAGAAWYGFLSAAVSLGTVAGFLVAGTLDLTGRARVVGILGAMFVYPVCFGLLAFIRSPALAVGTVFAGGAAVGLVNIYVVTLIQSSCPAELRGRVMGLLGTLSGGLVPLGMALGGVVGDLTDKNFPFVVLACSGLGLAFVLLLGTRSELRGFVAEEG